ncbi:hypothetical protein KY285_016411 [Solanum tuberosum]|nr:hypothetical protein KY284_016409 [Solanum tuberosum]KAH0702133.1 hypothetical protein KY285_016411 [Solanum tuberosum]
MDLARYSKEYIAGVESFLDLAYSYGDPQGEKIQCPCYTRWINHGEWDINLNVDDEMDYSRDDIDGLLNDQFRDVAQAEGVYDGPNEDAKKFYNLVEEASQELYPGCTGFSKLSFTLHLYLLKCLHGWSNESFTSLLELLKEAMPELNIPPSYNKTKYMVKNLDLDYEKIDAFDSELEPSKKQHRVSAKTLRHFPLIPRLKRLFMCSKTADYLRWHDEERSKDGKLRHPADGLAWKDFDRLHPDFALDCRNVRLGLSSDGFNPFRTMSISHSTWTVMLMVYNLPPWMCMKFEYSILPLLIPGPRSPGNDIDIYLQPLIDELKLLWDSRVETYDASRNQTFQMRVALMWTINDFPAYAIRERDQMMAHGKKGWQYNLLRHNLDVMHIEKNIVDSILGTLLDISGKTKDHAKARYDLKDTGIRKNLHPKDTEDSKRTKFAKACFSMTNGEKSIFCGVLKTAKLPDGSASNISSDAETVSLFPNKGVPLGAKKTGPFILDNKSLSQAYAYLLGNCDEVQEYIRDHEQEVNNQPRRSKWNKAKNHCQNFSQWFETCALQEDVPDLIKQLSRGPNSVAKRYFGYLTNGYRFHVRQRDARSKTQNSGVTLVASTTSFASSKDKNSIAADLTYYGRIVDIVELDYYGHFKVVLFKCDWYKIENDAYGLTYVYFNKRCSQEEPFVLGSKVHQCFYVQDPYDQDRHYLMKTVPRDLFNMGDEVESNLPQSYENEPYEYLMGPSIPKDNGEVLLTRTDVPETIIDVPSKEFVTQQLEVEYEEEFEDESVDEFEDESENEYEDEFENKYEDESEEEFEDDAP